MVWSVMRRYGAGCVLACVVVMVFVPFRGWWLVLPSKGTPVHNHPDTKGFIPADRPIRQGACGAVYQNVSFPWLR